ncbi:MAG: DNA polymerase III subunit gamma/tau [bacterium]
MNYKVLYRKYRPDDFDNLVGQDNIIKILTNSIINNKLSHAYIFSGPRGTGKTSSAKIFAKNINCLESKNGMACGECINCKSIENTSDIIEIDAASNNGVNEIREITNNIKLVPSNLKYKVYIIDEVHMLSNSAFNALLLTLEEPPAHVKFILATTNIENVPITILSRCQRFDFKKIDTKVIVDRLESICNLENINITKEALVEIAKISDGGLRDSLSLLDQLSKENEMITEDVVANYTGSVSFKVIENLFESLDNSDFINFEKIMRELDDCSIDYKLLIKNFISYLSEVIRNVLINNKTTRLEINEIKALAIELTDFQSKINVNVDVYSMMRIILFSYFSKETNVTNNKIDEIKVNHEEEIEVIVKEEVKQKEINVESEKIIVKENYKFENDDINVNSYNFALADIRINNCFAEAKLDIKQKNIIIWNDYLNNIDISLKGLLTDSEVAMSSDSILTISVERENDYDDILKLSDKIVLNYNRFTFGETKIVFITKKRWLELVNIYKKDKESGIIYTVKDENEFLDDVDIDDIFDHSKIEER